MALGGFSGRDPAPTPAQFQHDVRTGQVRYFLLGNADGPGGDSAAARIRDWVRATFVPLTVGGGTVYDLTAPR
jgi:hypothetical protein